MARRNPNQPLVVDNHGVVRFKRNEIVNDLLEFAQQRGFGLNEIAQKTYSREDRNQLAQLIGYSVSGWGSLSYSIDVAELDRRAAIAKAKGAKP